LRWWPASPAPSFDQDPADPGAANLFADGFSMAAANYSGTKAEIEGYAQVRMEDGMSSSPRKASVRRSARSSMPSGLRARRSTAPST
jgi:hypothetical protein